VRGLSEHVFRRSEFHDFACVVHRDEICHGADDAEVVRDEDDRGAFLALEFFEESEDLGLKGDIQGGGGFIGDEDFGVAGEGDGGHHALALPSAELVGEFFGGTFGGGNLNLRQAFDRFFSRFLPGHMAVEDQSLGNLVADAHDGVQAGEGVLEDNGDVFSSYLAHLLFAQFGQVCAVEEDLPPRDFPARREEAQKGKGGEGFSTSRFAHDAEGIPRLEMETNPADDFGVVQSDAKVSHVQKGHGVNYEA
jgi:hypothetical protein